MSPFGNMIFETKYLCEEKFHSADLHPRFPEIMDPKIC
ncbi:hypothetical protein T09_2013 [Trichinella sp. T9]|nr:hypothetical protein T09_2013 [Trichinella sp. T9]